MPDPAAQVKINALLMQREAAFVRIWEIEQRLQQILGQPFPLTIPVDLPSRRPPRKAGAKARQADARPRIRSLLREGETAWQLGGRIFLEENRILVEAIALIIRKGDETNVQVE